MAFEVVGELAGAGGDLGEGNANVAPRLRLAHAASVPWGVLATALVMLVAAVEVERVVALVNGVPVLTSDVEVAMATGLVPRTAGESDADYRRAVLEALVQLELRWQDLEAAGAASQLRADPTAAWERAAATAGGETALAERLAAAGLEVALARSLVTRATLVEAYVARRFAPFARPTEVEVRRAWEEEFVPQLRQRGEAVPEFEAVRPTVEAILRERKLTAEVARWSAELEARGEVVRYF